VGEKTKGPSAKLFLVRRACLARLVPRSDPARIRVPPARPHIANPATEARYHAMYASAIPYAAAGRVLQGRSGTLFGRRESYSICSSMNDWGFVWTRQFVVGTLIAGLLLNVIGGYLIRALDWAGKALPASFRRAQEAESARIEQLTSAALSDHALYAALAAEACRLRLHQLIRFFIAFMCAVALAVVLVDSNQRPPADTWAVVKAVLLIVVFLSIAFFQYMSGLDNSRRARRLDLALRAAHRSRGLPIMD
jgi:hypothetical protein